MTFDLDRRLVLGGGLAAGLGSLAAPALGALADTAAAATLQGSLPRKVDVVVVGAGLSGLVAARDVARGGRSVLVVEARDRVGGRLLNHHIEGGVIEAGGAFVGPTQTHILRLAKELGADIFPEHTEGKSVYVSSTLGRLEYSGTVPPDPTILVDALLLLQQLNGFAAGMPVDTPWAHPRAAEWDAVTLGDFIRANAINAAGITNLIKSWTQPGFGADPDQLSLLFVIHYIACSGNERNVGTFERNSDTAGGAQESRFVLGSQIVPLRLAQRLGERVALDAAVRRVEQHDGKVVVHTSRGDVIARHVIVAVPPALALDIDWRPGLPDRRRHLLAEMKMGRLMKCDAIYDKPFWREDGLNGFGINDSGAVRVAFDNCPKDGDPGVLLAFVGGSTWRKYGLMSRADRRKHVLEGFAALFGDKALHPDGYTEQDWSKETWTRGGPVAIMAPGTMTSYGSAIRKPFGRVHWAGTETSTYWTGYMDGAVRAGERAAVEVTG